MLRRRAFFVILAACFLLAGCNPGDKSMTLDNPAVHTTPAGKLGTLVSLPPADPEIQQLIAEDAVRQLARFYDPEEGYLRYMKRGTIPTIHYEADFALALLRADPAVAADLELDPVETATRILYKILSIQVTEPEKGFSPARYPHILYGTYLYPLWRPESEWPFPPERYEYDMFVVPTLLDIYISYGDRLPEEVRAALRDSLAIAADGVARGWYRVREFPEVAKRHNYWGHTNYTVMYLEILLLTAEISGDETLIAVARDAFDTWVRDVARRGFHEYDSTTYTGVTLTELGRLATLLRDEGLRAQVEALWLILWADMAASVFPGGSLGPAMEGANSRNYRPLAPNGGHVTHLYYAGLAGARPYLDPSKVRLTTTPFCPPQQILDLAAKPELDQGGFLVRQIWGDRPGQDRTTFITPDFCLGSAGAAYGGQDRNVALTYGANYPATTLGIDVGEGPLWEGRALTGHWPYDLSSVQDGGAVALITDFDTRPRGGLTPTTARMAWLLPAQVKELKAGTTPVDLSLEPRVLEVPHGGWVSWRAGRMRAAIQVLAAKGTPLRLVYDALPAGGQSLVRLEVLHHKGPDVLLEEGIWAASALVACTVSEYPTAQTFARALAGTRVSVTQDGPRVALRIEGELAPTPLFVARDLQAHRTVERAPTPVDWQAAGWPVLQAPGVRFQDGMLVVGKGDQKLGISLWPLP
jgi:hypothetical protein